VCFEESALPRSASHGAGSAEGSTRSDGLSEEPCRRLWYSQHPRPAQGEGKRASRARGRVASTKSRTALIKLNR